ncbi:hypothetical protein WJX84_001849 [Apatococcus fuscideae]|uniref:F-box domain-containing protein n=1 Tax=Apatococcus fuscideae TaxID=2026836 RepID=A0AAW1TD92_9CHLO
MQAPAEVDWGRLPREVVLRILASAVPDELVWLQLRVAIQQTRRRISKTPQPGQIIFLDADLQTLLFKERYLRDRLALLQKALDRVDCTCHGRIRRARLHERCRWRTRIVIRQEFVRTPGAVWKRFAEPT